MFGKQLFVHRIIWLFQTGSWPVGVVDHKDGNPSNNRWANLRDVSVMTNTQNQRFAATRNTTGMLGVSPYRKGFRAQIMVGGKYKFIGTYKTPELAQAAYIEAKRKLHEGCTI